MSEFHADAPLATASEGLAQDPYVAARAGFEPRQKASNLPINHRAQQYRPSLILTLTVCASLNFVRSSI